MKLAIQLTSGVEMEDVRTVRRLTEAALGQGHRVSIFLMDDGVYNVGALKGLAALGAEIAVCTHNCYERGISEVEGALFGGQNDWADMVNEADRVLVFG